MLMSSGSTPFSHYWVAARPIPGQRESGDQYVVATYEGGTLVAVIDGLGHGDEAAEAAKAAVAVLTAHANEPVVPLMKRCHEELRKTRGAVMSLASLQAATNTMSWIGIGNVEGMLLCSRKPGEPKRSSLMLRGGIVGDRLPPLLPSTMRVHAGDLLLFATDGIGSMFVKDARHTEHPRQLVHHIFVQYAKTTDDALVLGVQWKSGDESASRDSSNLQFSPRTSL